MSKVVADISMSLDGYVTGPNAEDLEGLLCPFELSARPEMIRWPSFLTEFGNAPTTESLGELRRFGSSTICGDASRPSPGGRPWARS